MAIQLPPGQMGAQAGRLNSARRLPREEQSRVARELGNPCSITGSDSGSHYSIGRQNGITGELRALFAKYKESGADPEREKQKARICEQFGLLKASGGSASFRFLAEVLSDGSLSEFHGECQACAKAILEGGGANGNGADPAAAAIVALFPLCDGRNHAALHKELALAIGRANLENARDILLSANQLGLKHVSLTLNPSELVIVDMEKAALLLNHQLNLAIQFLARQNGATFSPTKKYPSSSPLDSAAIGQASMQYS